MTEDRSVFDLPTRVPDETWAYGNDPDQVADLFGIPAPHPLVLIHGGYWRPPWDRTSLRPLAGALADAGYMVVSLEYRRIPGNPDAMAEDIASALNALAADEVTLIGHSAGGHLALWAAANIAKVKRVIALAPVSDLQMTQNLNLDNGAARDFLGCDASERPDLDPMKLSYPNTQIITIQGDQDIRVPIEMNRKFSQQHPKIKYLEYSGIGHFEVIDPGKSIVLRVIQAEEV